MSELTPESIAAQIQSMLDQSREKTHPVNSAPEPQTPDVLPANLPPLQEGQFLLKVPAANSYALFCMRELCWPEAQDIEVQAFRYTDQNDMYFVEEFERRETLKKALVWVCEQDKIVFNDCTGSLLGKIHSDIINALWDKYKEATTLYAHEASALYNAAYHYFTGDVQTEHPVPSIVIDVDFFLKGVQWTRSEFRRFSASDLERIQMVLAGRSDALKVSRTAAPANSTQLTAPSEQLSPDMIATFPPHIRQRLESRR